MFGQRKMLLRRMPFFKIQRNLVLKMAFQESSVADNERLSAAKSALKGKGNKQENTVIGTLQMNGLCSGRRIDAGSNGGHPGI
jgi:hypothetical protein